MRYTRRAERSVAVKFPILYIESHFQIKKFLSYSGALPAPECSGNPLGCKFSWWPRGFMLGILNSASYLSDGQVVDVPGGELMEHTQPYFISPAFAFAAFPDRNSVPFKEFYNIPEAETVVRGTLRYQCFPEFANVLVKLGLLDFTEKVWLKGSFTWAQIMQKVLGATEPTER
jgi:spermidine synthase / saccharopine dehydrogenase (NADP+, L-glutamate-forming)